MKLNAVLRRSSFERDVPALLEFAAANDIEVRFIELMQTGPAAGFAEGAYVSSRDVRECLGLEGVLERAAIGGGPARRLRVRFRGLESRTGWIEPISHSFCEGCQRLRLDPLGNLRRCLMDPEPFPLPERMGAGKEIDLFNDVERFLRGKKAPDAFETPRSMASIGG